MGTPIISLAAAIVLAGIQPSRGGVDEFAAIRQARKQVAERPRRIIYNNDGYDIMEGATPERFLANRLGQIPGTQVDTVFYCTGVTGLFTSHLPRVGETLDEFVTDSSPETDIGRRDALRAMKAAGHDPLIVAIDFCHENQIEIFFSLRMNDIHDSMPHSRPFLPRWKRQRPHVMLGRDGDFDRYPAHDPRAWWSSLDYELPEVRDYVFRILEDVCGRYDVDGLELDFLRHPKFFRPTLTLQPAEPGHSEAMNDLLRRIRTMTDEVARRRGRPLPIACRVPLSLQCAAALGLDVVRWVKEDLCDMLVVGGGYVPMAMFDDVREMAAFGHGHGVPVYACISASALDTRNEWAENWRAAAMNIWQAGADGVYLFNFVPDRPYKLLSQLGGTDTLKGLDKTYGVDHVVVDRFGGYQRPGIVAAGRLPVALPPDGWAQVKLPVGEDVAANAPSGKTATTRLRVRVSSFASGDRIVARLNGLVLGEAKPATPPEGTDAPPTAEGLLSQVGRSRPRTPPANTWLEIDVDPDKVAVGNNLVALRFSSSRNVDQPMSWDELELVLRYR